MKTILKKLQQLDFYTPELGDLYITKPFFTCLINIKKLSKNLDPIKTDVLVQLLYDHAIDHDNNNMEVIEGMRSEDLFSDLETFNYKLIKFLYKSIYLNGTYQSICYTSQIDTFYTYTFNELCPVDLFNKIIHTEDRLLIPTLEEDFNETGKILGQLPIPCKVEDTETYLKNKVEILGNIIDNNLQYFMVDDNDEIKTFSLTLKIEIITEMIKTGRVKLINYNLYYWSDLGVFTYCTDINNFTTFHKEKDNYIVKNPNLLIPYNSLSKICLNINNTIKYDDANKYQSIGFIKYQKLLLRNRILSNEIEIKVIKLNY